MDVSEHTLVPEHRLLDEDEVVERVLDEYDVEKVNLPKILRKDPAVPDGAEPGDVVEIVRHESRTTDVARVYRLVVE